MWTEAIASAHAIKHSIKHLHSFVSHLLFVRKVVVQICSGLGLVHLGPGKIAVMHFVSGTDSLTPKHLCSGL